MSLLSSLFKTKKTPSYQGMTPRSSLLESTGGPEYYQTLLDRINGRNVGFGDTYASQYANPIIQNQRANFTDYQLPELTSELSLTGRRKGSAGFSQIAKAYQQEGNNEGDIFSRLQQRNEDQKRAEINAAIPALGSFNSNENNVYNNAANFDYNKYTGEVANRNNDFNANQKTAGNIVNAVGQGITQFALPGVSSFLPSGSPMVNYGGANYATSQPPYGSTYGSNIFSRIAQRQGQYGGIR